MRENPPMFLELWQGNECNLKIRQGHAGRTGDGDSAFVQLINLQKVGPYYRTWTKLVDSTGARTLSYGEFDLKQYRMRELHMIEYDAHGKTLNNGASDDTWTYYPPDSFHPLV